MEILVSFFKDIIVDKLGDLFINIIMKILKNRSLIALISIYVAIIFNYLWIFGILLLVWVVQDISTKQTYLLEIVLKEDKPFLYWSIVITWFILAILSFPFITDLLV